MSRKFFDKYDHNPDKFNYILAHLQEETKSNGGVVCRYRGSYLIPVCSDPPNFIYEPHPLIDRSIRTCNHVIGESAMLPPFGKVSKYLIMPIIGDGIIGIVILVGGLYTPEWIQEIKGITVCLRLLLEKESSPLELKGKDLFLANMSHEIRTPLNGIIGYAQLLLQSRSLEIQRQYIHSINKCGVSLARVINDILDFSKLASGKMKVTPKNTSINALINFVSETLHPRITEKKQILELSINVPEKVSIDQQKLTQILMNLLSNAVKFTPEGGKITLTAEKLENKTLKFTVTDTGCGISRQDQTRLFRAFTQLDNHLNRNIDGTGLGLAISKKLVELLQGEISLSSRIGEGSNFFFTVKYAQLHLDDSKKFQGKKFLLIHSDTFHLSEDLGGAKTISTTPTSFNNVMSNHDFDLVISTPEMISKIREISPSLPIISASPLADGIYSDDPLELFESIEKVLSHSSHIKKKDSLKLNRNISILIVEDNTINRELLRVMLSSLEYFNVTDVCDGIDAIKALNDKEYHTILLDLKMPRMDGYQVMEFLKRSSRSSPRIIPITASVSDEDYQHCMQYPISTFLRKPISLQDLRKALK